jgi:hypothetical protein
MTVLSELVYCFQGVEGNVLKKDLQHGFVIDPQVFVVGLFIVVFILFYLNC